MLANLNYFETLFSVAFIEKINGEEKVFAALEVPEGAIITVRHDGGVTIVAEEDFIDQLVALSKLANYDFHKGKNWFECIASNGKSSVFNKDLWLRLNGRCADEPKYFFK